MKVGLSLSFCIKDLLAGNVQESEVKFISTGTRALSPEDWKKVLESYRRWYWSENPDRGEALARKFLEEGRLIQPRSEGLNPASWAGRGSCWCEEEEYNQRMLQGQHRDWN